MKITEYTQTSKIPQIFEFLNGAIRVTILNPNYNYEK